MIGKRFRSLPFIFANDNYTLSPACAVKYKEQPPTQKQQEQPFTGNIPQGIFAFC